MKISLDAPKTTINLADSDAPIFAQLVGVGDMGICKETFQGDVKELHKLRFYFVGYQKAGAELDMTKPIPLNYEVTFSLNEKSRLFKMVKAWKGSVSAELDISSLVGQNVKLKVEDRVVGEKTYQNIISFASHELLTEKSVSWPRHEWMVASAKGQYGLFGNFTALTVTIDDEAQADIDVSKVAEGLDEPKAKPADQAKPKVDEIDELAGLFD